MPGIINNVIQESCNPKNNMRIKNGMSINNKLIIELIRQDNGKIIGGTDNDFRIPPLSSTDVMICMDVPEKKVQNTNPESINNGQLSRLKTSLKMTININK